jgi:uncharacterized protein
MTFAWYGHLKFSDRLLWLAIVVSWSIALVEYCFAVPANRWGAVVYSAAELKTVQEVIAMTVFTVFSVFYLGERITLNHMVGFALICAGAFFVFKGPLCRRKREASCPVALPQPSCARDTEATAGLSGPVLQDDRAAHAADNAVHDREAEARSLARRLVFAIEPLEHAVELGGRNAAVAHAQHLSPSAPSWSTPSPGRQRRPRRGQGPHRESRNVVGQGGSPTHGSDWHVVEKAIDRAPLECRE